MGIRVRIAALFAALVAVLVTIGAVGFAVDFSGGLRRSLESALRARAERIIHDARGGHVDDPVGQLFAKAVADAGQSVTQLLGRNGTVLVTTEAAGPSPLVTKGAVHAASIRDRYVAERLPRQGGRWLLLVTAWPAGGEVLVTGRPLDTVDDAVARARVDALVAAALAVVLAAVAGWSITGWALRPVERLRAGAAAIVDNDLGEDLPVPPTGDELAALAATLNALVARWRQVLVRQRELVSAASHELRTPLAALHTQLELARRSSSGDGELSEALDRALDRSRRLARLATDLLTLAETDEGVPLRFGPPSPVEPVVAGVLEDWRARAAAGDVLLVLDVEAGATTPVDTDRLRQIVDNLVSNAVRFAPEGSLVEVSVDVTGSSLRLCVADHGPGFAPDLLPRAFERFTRSGGDRGRATGGAGLGLAIVRAIAEGYGGTAVAANRASGGAMVVVTLPLASGAGALGGEAPGQAPRALPRPAGSALTP